MRKSVTSFTLASLLFVGASAGAVLAQTSTPADSSAPPPPPAMAGPHGHGMQPPDPAKQLARMTKHLSLSADQQSQIKPILEDRDQQAMTLHSDTSMSPQDKMAKMKSLRSDSDAKIEAILNDQQKQKYAEMKQKQQHMMHQHMDHEMGGMGPDAPPPPPPPAQ